MRSLRGLGSSGTARLGRRFELLLPPCRARRGQGGGLTSRVMKNWEPLVSLPELAMLTMPARSCFAPGRFSSAKRPPLPSQTV
jgi:hypothetical protein